MWDKIELFPDLNKILLRSYAGVFYCNTGCNNAMMLALIYSPGQFDLEIEHCSLSIEYF
jgi:hypothetical protein